MPVYVPTTVQSPGTGQRRAPGGAPPTNRWANSGNHVQIRLCTCSLPIAHPWNLHDSRIPTLQDAAEHSEQAAHRYTAGALNSQHHLNRTSTGEYGSRWRHDNTTIAGESKFKTRCEKLPVLGKYTHYCFRRKTAAACIQVPSNRPYITQT